jgi:hypothetical protein
VGASSLSKRQRAIREGYRSGLEDDVSSDLKDRGVLFEYETIKIEWVDLKHRKYTPDFVLLSNGIIVETKGRFKNEDRRKHVEIKKQYPDLDIRFVFSNSKSKLYKGAKSTYADWCNKNGFIFSDLSIPQEWLDEPPEKKRMSALDVLLNQKKRKV